ncbi:MAG: metal-dependent phosphohydrolase [Candidatus Entotheonella factor]|uniref:Metal-dependent phosphohydrolase n=1 Tax=Entotheonella factor TaxID=1429438 RepID=W4LYI3_ENTF1|nr:Npun_R2479 family HD domain-containing metalloprotein [Candidatus Entotheonella palauensis]ETX03164.1 MAG: metal-dependent phosphohydrolase [Candidatus Entotheonella factor]
MFNPTEHLIDAFVGQLGLAYQRTYGQLEPDYPGILGWAGRMALELIASSDALYHNVEHTLMVTLVGQEILKGKHLREGGVEPCDWLHFMLSLLCHDLGYIRGVCREDCEGVYTTGGADEMITLPPGATDAALTPYHVDRGKRFVYERFGGHDIINADVIAANIERTRFPVPNDADHQGTTDYPGLVRAADLIGQLADPHYLRKIPALFYEFQETGVHAQLGLSTPHDLRKDYPAFFWNVAYRYLRDSLRYLSWTQEGNQWIANLYAHVFAVEHDWLDKK